MIDFCLICNREFKQDNILLSLILESAICNDCFTKLPFLIRSIKMGELNCFCLYKYDGIIKEMLMNFKVKGDIKLSNFFFSPFTLLLNWKYKGYVIVPIPSNKSSDKKRGFNHVYELAKELNLPILDCFYKKKMYKQSDRKYKDRKNIEKVIYMKNVRINSKQKYLIIDDILTSGSTMRRCFNLLKMRGAIHIKGLVVATNYYDYKK